MGADPAAKDVAALDGLITKLQVAYEQYFSGGQNREPVDVVRQVEEIIRTYTHGQIQSPTLRFRFNSLMARYNSCRSVWERRKRRLEGAAPTKSYTLRHEPREDEGGFTFVIPAGPLDDVLVGDIFDRYMELRRRCGEPLERITVENFKGILSAHVSRLRERTGRALVVVKVDTHENRSRISARPLE